VTILYDAFGESKELTKDWGYSALVEHNGKRILFDTGNDAAIFEHNVKALGVDLTKLDFVVISHRHADHTTGLRYVLKVNPNATVYVPADGGNGFGGLPLPKTSLRADESLPAKMRYFGGADPEHFTWGKLYDTGNFVAVSIDGGFAGNFSGANSFAEERDAGAAGIDAGDQKTEWIAAGGRVLARGD
jgi:7,8-dihydropterin-6-yl-methyl-4-(beta-D-ribofuranosyl)aminobenzene 5'-phosphate synthase